MNTALICNGRVRAALLSVLSVFQEACRGFGTYNSTYAEGVNGRGRALEGLFEGIGLLRVQEGRRYVFDS
jgi:hypothetical protein